MRPSDFPKSIVVHLEGEDTKEEFFVVDTDGHGSGLNPGQKRLEGIYTLERVVEVEVTAQVKLDVPSAPKGSRRKP